MIYGNRLSIDEAMILCKDCHAEVYSYTLSLSELIIRFHEKKSEKSTFIVCNGCRKVSFVPYWENISLDITGSDGQFVVDAGKENLVVMCGFVRAFDNVDLE